MGAVGNAALGTQSQMSVELKRLPNNHFVSGRIIGIKYKITIWSLLLEYEFLENRVMSYSFLFPKCLKQFLTHRYLFNCY